MNAEVIWFYAYKSPHDPTAIARQDLKFAQEAVQQAEFYRDGRRPETITRYFDAKRAESRARRWLWELERGY